MKQTIVWTALAACAATSWAQTPRSDADRGKSGTTIPYSGGGIRGHRDLVADGTLVSPEEAREFRGDSGFEVAPPLRPRSLRPGIDLLQPTPAPGVKLRSPFAVSLQFRPLGDVPIVPGSFKVLYGAGKLDITERVTQLAQPTPAGITFEAKLPPGRHQLTVQVQDAQQRSVERELRFEVE